VDVESSKEVALMRRGRGHTTRRDTSSAREPTLFYEWGSERKLVVLDEAEEVSLIAGKIEGREK